VKTVQDFSFDFSRDFTKAVKKEIEKRNMTKRNLADAAGISEQYLGELLLGQKRWNATSINKVCAALNIAIKFVSKKGTKLSETGT
jgi:transcriptional regulator with XRE-family HTH domain